MTKVTQFLRSVGMVRLRKGKKRALTKRSELVEKWRSRVARVVEMKYDCCV